MDHRRVSWRWIFYINLPVGIASLIMISLFVTDPPYMHRGSLRVDFWGFGMLAVGMGALQIMLDKARKTTGSARNFIVMLAITAAVLLIGFVIRELVIDQPIVHFELFKYRTFAAGIFFVTMLGFVLYGSLILLPLFMQTLLGWTSATAGPVDQPARHRHGAVHAAGGVPARQGLGWPLAVGVRFRRGRHFPAGLFRHETFSPELGTSWYGSSARGSPVVHLRPLTTLTMDPIPKRETGYATALYSVMRNIGSSVGISFVTTWLERRAQFNQTVLAAHVTLRPSAQRC